MGDTLLRTSHLPPAAKKLFLRFIQAASCFARKQGDSVNDSRSFDQVPAIFLISHLRLKQLVRSLFDVYRDVLDVLGCHRLQIDVLILLLCILVAKDMYIVFIGSIGLSTFQDYVVLCSEIRLRICPIHIRGSVKTYPIRTLVEYVIKRINDCARLKMRQV